MGYLSLFFWDEKYVEEFTELLVDNMWKNMALEIKIKVAFLFIDLGVYRNLYK
jgi:hypothetical protein